MKIRTLLITSALLFTGYALTNQTVNAEKASYEYAALANTKVIVTKDMKVYQVKAGAYEAANKFKLFGTVKKGTFLYVSKWFMSTGGGRVIYNSKTYIPDEEHFYFVYSGEHSKWYTSYTPQKLKAFKAKAAKKAAAAKKKKEVKQEKLYKQNVAYASSHPLLASQYKNVSAYVGDDVFDLHRNNLQKYDDSTNTISSYYAPNDSKAEVPHDYKPNYGDEWDFITNDSKTIKVYKYIDSDVAKEFWNSDTPGWIYVGDESL